MNSMIVMPYMIKNYCSSTGCTLRENYILVGADCEGKVYKCKLFFNTMLLEPNSIVLKATLRMFCNIRNPSPLLTLIYAQISGVRPVLYTQTSVEGAGWYEWDVTELVETCKPLTQFCICLFTKHDKYYDAKTFCTQASSYPASLEIITYQDKEKNIYEQKEDCIAADDWRYSKWINCSAYKNYVYHIYNAGKTDIDIVLHVSPNKEYVAENSPRYTVKPETLIVVDPWKYSFYIRAAFKNMIEGNNNLVRLWFQALK